MEPQKKCSRCHNVLYCSKECQTVHWKKGQHKKFCIPPTLRRPDLFKREEATKVSDICLICRGNISIEDDFIKLHCAHVYHFECIVSLGFHSLCKICPSCRSPLPDISNLIHLRALRTYAYMSELFKKRTGNPFMGNAEASHKDLDSRESLLLKKTLALQIKAAEMNHVESQYMLGNSFHRGIMIEVDLLKAAHWYEKAATNGHMISQRLLGVLHMDGILDSKPNMVEAAMWLTEASKQGCSQSQCALGSILRRDNGVQENRDEALRLLSASAAQGCKEAICELGICYYEGDLVMRSLGLAAVHFRLASAKGDLRGSLLLGECYLRGHGVKQDYANAQFFAKRASLLAPEEEFQELRIRVRIFFEREDSVQHF